MTERSGSVRRGARRRRPGDALEHEPGSSAAQLEDAIAGISGVSRAAEMDGDEDILSRVVGKLKTDRAVAVLGAGLSRAAGMPLVAELSPLLWHAFDAVPTARADLADRLGRPDSPAKELIGEDLGATPCFEVLRDHPEARIRFQHAFAHRDAAADLHYAAHDALARLFHHGMVELIVSYNWDTLFERCYARLYGRLPSANIFFWKPHGDAKDPHQDWVLPGDSGVVPQALIDRVLELVQERPRLLLVIGYSESDEQVVRLLTEPLSTRWSICRVGPQASGALALTRSANEVLPEIALRLAPDPEKPIWEYVIFNDNPDLAPALLGRGLGPANAVACPQLPEVDILLEQIRAASTVRLAGESGGGKSLCAYQVARHLSLDGFEIVRLVNPNVRRPDLALAGLRFPTVVLLDDAHLVPDDTVRRLEEYANPQLLLIIVVSQRDDVPIDRGAIRLDAKRAVQVIAAALLAGAARTLEAVRRVDDRVGEGYLDERLEERIMRSAERAEVPWQFCFSLGGGWRRAALSADAARAEGADLVLACAAVHQLASGDAFGTASSVARLAAKGHMGHSDFERAVRWLARERLILSESDVRCPHQRFAAAVLNPVYAGLETEQRTEFLSICRHAITDPAMPLSSVQGLLQDLRLGERLRLACLDILNEKAQRILLRRCFASRGPGERMGAALLLAELESFVAGWPRTILAQRKNLIARWIEDASHPSGFGLARLMNNVWNRDKDFAQEICEATDPEAVATRVSHVRPNNAWSLGKLLDRLLPAATTGWRSRVRNALDRKIILNTVSEWPPDSIDSLGPFAIAAEALDEDLGLSMLERAEPVLRQRFAVAPLNAFLQLSEVLMRTLRAWDPLGVYVGALRPSARKLGIARRLCTSIDAEQLAKVISFAARRDLEPYSRLLSLLRRVAPRLRRAVVRRLDFDRLDFTFDAYWRTLPHDMLVFVGQLGLGGNWEPAASWIGRNAHKIERMATPLAVLSPNAAIDVLDRKGSIPFGSAMIVDWLLVALAIDTVVNRRPDLAEALVQPQIAAVAKALESNQANTLAHVDSFVRVLQERAPTMLMAILDRVDPSKAERAWAACLRDSAVARRSGAVLIEVAVAHGREIGDVGRRLRARFPSASRPDARLSAEIVGSGARHRKKRPGKRR